jgi:hypothetical protein
MNAQAEMQRMLGSGLVVCDLVPRMHVTINFRNQEGNEIQKVSFQAHIRIVSCSCGSDM